VTWHSFERLRPFLDTSSPFSFGCLHNTIRLAVRAKTYHEALLQPLSHHRQPVAATIVGERRRWRYINNTCGIDSLVTSSLFHLPALPALAEVMRV
jgi:hypothetical protein